MIFRLWWRYINPRPRDLGPNAFENQLGRLMHVFLYVLVLLQPIFGILMSQAFGSPVRVFGSAGAFEARFRDVDRLRTAH